jgi:hypothetical protein
MIAPSRTPPSRASHGVQTMSWAASIMRRWAGISHQMVDGVLAGRVAWLAIEGLPPVRRRLLKRIDETGTVLPAVHFLVVAVAHFQAQRRTAGIVHVPEEVLGVKSIVGNVVCLHGRSVQILNSRRMPHAERLPLPATRHQVAHAAKARWLSLSTCGSASCRIRAKEPSTVCA